MKKRPLKKNIFTTKTSLRYMKHGGFLLPSIMIETDLCQLARPMTCCQLYDKGINFYANK